MKVLRYVFSGAKQETFVSNRKHRVIKDWKLLFHVSHGVVHVGPAAIFYLDSSVKHKQVYIYLQDDVSKFTYDMSPDEEVEELEGVIGVAPPSWFLQLFRVTILAWHSRKLARQIALPFLTWYRVENMGSVSEKFKSSMLKMVLRAAKIGCSWGQSRKSWKRVSFTSSSQKGHADDVSRSMG